MFVNQLIFLVYILRSDIIRVLGFLTGSVSLIVEGLREGEHVAVAFS